MPARERRFVAAITFLLAMAEAGPAAAQDVRIPSPGDAAHVSRALAGARRRLDRPACQQVFSDFRGADGLPLQAGRERLAARGAGVLDALIFYDGDHRARCQNGRTLAFTHPGSAIVFVCTAQFAATAFHDPVVAEAALIHESLHALGLPDDRPSSAAITSRVIARCH